MKKTIIEKSLENAISYPDYRTLVEGLIVAGKSTGKEQSESLLNYTVLNDKRMKRLDKTIRLTEETKTKLQEVNTPQTWLLITESWCGDAAQTLPIIYKMAEENKLLTLKIVLRDDHEALMDLFLTNGSKSVPKLIVLNAHNEVLNSWGPRPTIATKMVADYKAKHGKLDADFKQDLQVWYNKDKGKNTQEDLLAIL